MRFVLDIKSCRSWLFITLFCILFSSVYECFSFGVISLNMILLFMYPLLLGVIPCLILKKDMGRFYNDGVLLLTLASMLNGIFDIYGTNSSYPAYMIVLGILLMLFQIIISIHNHNL